MIRVGFGSQRLFSLYLKEDEKPVKKPKPNNTWALEGEHFWRENNSVARLLFHQRATSRNNPNFKKGSVEIRGNYLCPNRGGRTWKDFFYKQSIAQSSLYDGSPLYLFLQNFLLKNRVIQYLEKNWQELSYLLKTCHNSSIIRH